MPAACSVFLNVRDIEKSVAFYRDLGFQVKKEYRDEDTGDLRYADLALQGAELGLGSIASNDDPEYRRWVSGELGAGVIVYFTVVNVDKVHDAAQRAGAAIESPLADRSYGRAFNLNDPDGYVVSFLTERKRRPARRAAAAAAKKPATRRAGARGAAPKKAARGARRKAKR